MDFDFSDDQKAIRDAVRRLLATYSPPERVRRIVNDEAPFDTALWRQLADLGYLGSAIGEEYGGAGLGFLELCLLAEEMGRALAPVPFMASICFAATAIDRFGSTAQKSRWLPKLATGEVIGTLALVESPGPLGGGAVWATVRDGCLYGQKIAVPYGAEADIAIVAARDEISQGNATFFIVDLKHNAVRRRSTPGLDLTQRQGCLHFDGAGVERLGACQSYAEVEDLLNVAAVLIAFDQLGGADRALELARNYARERYAFGRPIGSFQALKHKMADMYVATVLARSNAYYGAWALHANAPKLPAAAAGARLSATEAYQLCSRECIQIHGGMGFTWDMPAHWYYRRSNHLAIALGGSLSWSDRLIDALAADDASRDVKGDGLSAGNPGEALAASDWKENAL